MKDFKRSESIINKPTFHTVRGDLYIYPKIIETEPSDYKFIVGDLHGNALRALYFALQVGLVELPRENYDVLVEIYKKNYKSELTKEEFATIEELFQNLTKLKDGHICFVGDTLADRSWHDGVFLHLLKHFHRLGLQIEILLSNHDMEFIFRMYKKNMSDDIILLNDYAASVLRLSNSIRDGVTTFEEIENEYKAYFLPTLRAVQYILIGEGILLLSHAAIGIEQIKHLANKWNIEFADDSPQQLANSIDKINVYLQVKAQNNCLQEIINPGSCVRFTPINSEKFPLEFIMWNGFYNINRPSHHKGYPVYYGHGHDGKNDDEHNNGFIFNLDHTNGLGFRDHKTDLSDNAETSYLRVKKMPQLILVDESTTSENMTASTNELITPDLLPALLKIEEENLKNSHIDANLLEVGASETKLLTVAFDALSLNEFPHRVEPEDIDNITQKDKKDILGL